jgi:hypothetical protein
MMQAQKMFPFIFRSFLQAAKENWWRRLQELASALSIFHECKERHRHGLSATLVL